MENMNCFHRITLLPRRASASAWVPFSPTSFPWRFRLVSVYTCIDDSIYSLRYIIKWVTLFSRIALVRCVTPMDPIWFSRKSSARNVCKDTQNTDQSPELMVTRQSYRVLSQGIWEILCSLIANLIVPEIQRNQCLCHRNEVGHAKEAREQTIHGVVS